MIWSALAAWTRGWVWRMDARKPMIVITGRGRPHEVVLFAYSVLAGAVYGLGAEAPRSLQGLGSVWLVRGWALALLASGAFGLLSLAVWRTQPLRALRLEGGALLLGAGALLVSSVQVFALAAESGSAWRGVLPGGIAAAWAAANVVRAWQCRRDGLGLLHAEKRGGQHGGG